MNALSKTKDVRKALKCCRYCERYRPVCNECPYDENGCKPALYDDVLEVIDGFKAELKKKKIFITLSVITDSEKYEKIAINVNDILLISDASNSFGGGSIISTKAVDGADKLTLYVKDTLEDILKKISNEENKNG